MRRAVVLLGITAACLPPAVQQPVADPSVDVQPQGDASAFAGTFAANGATIELAADGNQVSGTLRGGGMTGEIRGVVDGGGLTGEIEMSDGSSGAITAYTTATGIAIAVDGRQPVELARIGAGGSDGRTSRTSGTEAAPTKTTTTLSDKPAPKVKAKPATGTAYRDDMDGWEVRTPSGWKYGVKGSTVLFGSDTEAGLIVVAFNRGVTFDQMTANVESVIARLGATQLGAATPFKVKGGKGLVVEMTGTTADGTALHGRSAGVAGKTGIVTITGITTPEKIDGLRKRVDAIALSARFFTPKQTAAMRVLVGPWWHYHGTSTGGTGSSASSSYERTIELCADGTFYDSSESVIDAQAENRNPSSDYYGSSTSASRVDPDAGAGRWTASGDDASGRLRLVFDSGVVEEHAYVFQKRGGGDLELDGRWYGYAKDKGGQCR